LNGKSKTTRFQVTPKQNFNIPISFIPKVMKKASGKLIVECAEKGLCYEYPIEVNKEISTFND
jgi:hypothetical protein